MRRVFLIFLLIAAVISVAGCCCPEKTPELTVIEFASSRDADYNFGGRPYLVLLCKQGENYFLQSHIPDDTGQNRTVFARNLGKNVLIASNGLTFEDGQMTVEYRDCNEKWHNAGVPFGDFYGDKHVSQVKFIEELPNEPVSDKYRPAGVLKREEQALETFLPTLKKHIRNNDADAISKMLIYPIRVSSPAIGDIWLENRQEFLKYYPQIFTEAVKREMLKLQNKDILCNYQGLMINRGMWFHLGNDGKAYFYALGPASGVVDD